jgi:hypothetical protein
MSETNIDADAVAVQELEALVQVPHALRIITNEVHPDLRMDATDPRSEAHPAKLAEDPMLLTKTTSFVIHDVVRLEGPNERGQYTAYSAEGDYTTGQPAALLKRLREWRA